MTLVIAIKLSWEKNKKQWKTGWKDERNRKTVSIITRKIESTKRKENEQGTIRVRGEKD